MPTQDDTDALIRAALGFCKAAVPFLEALLAEHAGDNAGHRAPSSDLGSETMEFQQSWKRGRNLTEAGRVRIFAAFSEGKTIQTASDLMHISFRAAAEYRKQWGAAQVAGDAK